MKTKKLLVVTFSLGLIPLGLCCVPRVIRPDGYKRIEVTTILGDVSFSVPSRWLEPRSRLRLSKEELLAANNDNSEWGYEYITVANYILPFDACVMHIDREKWKFSGCSLRVYAIEADPKQIEAKAVSLGNIAPKTLFSRRKNYRSHGIPVRYGPQFGIKRVSLRPWQKIKVGHHVWYGDYGGSSRVDLRVKQVDGGCLVFVFMYVSDPHALYRLRSNVLNSVSIQKQ